MGTWRVSGSEDTTAIWVEDENGQRVATVRNCDNDLDRANLIASAPELLAALEAAEELHRIGLFNAADGQIQRVNELRSAAIAKATGSQS